VILRYAILQVPGLAAAVGVIFLLRRWILFPDSYAWIGLGLWILKDVILFPFVWHAYDWDDPGRTGSMIGRPGRVTVRLAPAGYVEIGGELWLAEATEPLRSIEVGERITVEDVEGLKLFVRREEPLP
jgi:membrane protein implicated in regulation of membrane protease activity